MRSMTLKARLVERIGEYGAGDFIDYAYHDPLDNSLRVEDSVADGTGRVWIWDGEYEFVPDEVEETPDEGKKYMYAVTVKVGDLDLLAQVLDTVSSYGWTKYTSLKLEEN